MGKDTIYLNGLVNTGSAYGYDHYSMVRYNEKIKVEYQPQTGHLKVSGSLPYFVDGQNFHNDIAKLLEGISTISDTINVDLFKAEVNCFEAGITFQTFIKPIEIFNSHFGIPEMQTSHFKRGKIYQDGIRQIKLYNAGYRLKKNVSKEKRLRLATEKGYDPEYNYLRFESRYKKPAIYFKQRLILVEDIFKDEFLNRCKIDLLNTYGDIKKEGVFTLPSNKRDCSLCAIALIVMKEQSILYGYNAEELLRNKINSIPLAILNKEDKKNRKRTLRGLSKKIAENKISYYDLNDVLKRSLQIE